MSQVRPENVEVARERARLLAEQITAFDEEFGPQFTAKEWSIPVENGCLNPNDMSSAVYCLETFVEYWQDADRTYTPPEQQLDTRIDGWIERREAALVETV